MLLGVILLGSIPVRVTKKAGHLSVSCFFVPSYKESHLSPRLRGIGFANSAKRRSVLAQDLADEFSAKSFSSKAPSRTFLSECKSTPFFVVLHI